MVPVRIEAKADVLGALGFEKVEAAQEDTLRRKRRTLCLARHPAMLVRLRFFPVGI
jgi:hypothetical protein